MKKYLSLISLVLVVVLLVSCSVSYSSTLNATKKWAEKVADVYVDYLNGFVGKTFKELASDSSDASTQWQQKLEDLGNVAYPYDTRKKMKDVTGQSTYVDGDSFYIVVYVPLPKDENDYAEDSARKKGDRYYVISVVRIKTDGNLEEGNADVRIKRIQKDVYISSELPVEN